MSACLAVLCKTCMGQGSEKKPQQGMLALQSSVTRGVAIALRNVDRKACTVLLVFTCEETWACRVNRSVTRVAMSVCCLFWCMSVRYFISCVSHLSIEVVCVHLELPGKVP